MQIVFNTKGSVEERALRINLAMSNLISRYKQEFLKEGLDESSTLYQGINRRTKAERILTTRTG